MKAFKVVSFAIVFFAASVSAQANDLDNNSRANWSGLYVGVQGGYGWGDGAFNFINTPAQAGFPDLEGGVVGGQIGYQYQFGSIVAGIEASALGGDVDGTGPDLLVPLTQEIAIGVDNILMINGRLGWAGENWLIYATGGYARADVSAVLRSSVAAIQVGGKDESHNGWNIGGGIEYLIHSNLSVAVDYRRIELDDEIHLGINNIGFNPFTSFRHRVDADIDLITARLNFHLN